MLTNRKQNFSYMLNIGVVTSKLALQKRYNIRKRNIMVYSLRPIIFVHLRLDTQTNIWCQIIKIPFVFCEKNPDTILSLVRRMWILFCLFCEKTQDILVFYGNKVKVAIFYGINFKLYTSNYFGDEGSTLYLDT